MRWRLMQESDLAVVADLSNLVYLDYPEDLDMYVQCFRLYPNGCHVLEDDSAAVTGYLVGHPDRIDDPPVLNVPLDKIPEAPDCYFLHDLAIEAESRGRGMAGLAVDQVLADARSAALNTVGLIAVGEAHAFWARHGFVTHGSGRLVQSKGYGPEARRLIRKL